MNQFVRESSDITKQYSLSKDQRVGDPRPPSFEYTTHINEDNPFIVEFRIQNVSFSDSGDYRILFYQQIWGTEVVTITVNCKFFEANLYK